MQGAMEDHPVQFGFDTGTQGLGIILYPVNTDINFANGGRAGRQVECDDVRIIIMLQVLPVNFKEAIVGTEDIIERLKRLPFFFKKGFNTEFQRLAVFQRKPIGFEEETNF